MLEADDSYLFTDEIVTVFCPGNLVGHYWAALYAGPRGLDIAINATEREHIQMTGAGPPLLHNIYAGGGGEMNDMAYGASWNPLHWVSKAVHYATHLYYGIGSTRVPYNQLSMLNFGGNEDVTQYLATLRACLQSNKEKYIVLFGSGRGAATILVALIHLTTQERARIALAILESPFASVPSLCQDSSLGSLSVRLLQRLTHYEADQRSPLNAVRDANFPLQIPLAFVSSKADTVVPERHTLLLVEELRAREHQKLEHLSLFLPSHTTMALATEESGKYLAFVGSLYNKYCP